MASCIIYDNMATYCEKYILLLTHMYFFIISTPICIFVDKYPLHLASLLYEVNSLYYHLDSKT